MKLVLADDEILALQLMEKLIDWESKGICITGLALNGKEARNIIENHSPDILITDIRMPEMDGLELTKWVRTQNMNMKVIIISAYSEFEYAQKALAYGASGYLLKPVDEDKLEELVEKVTQELLEEKSVQLNLLESNIIAKELLLRQLDEELFIEYLNNGNGNGAVNLVEKIFKDLSLRTDIEPKSIYYFCLELLLIVKQKILKGKKADTNIPELKDLSLENLKGCKTLKDLENYVIEVIYKFVNNSSDRDSENTRLIRKAKKFIDFNYNKNVTLEEICESISVSKNYFCYLFKRELGESVWDYLTRYRIEKAKMLLDQSDMKNYEISYGIGYENPSYFTKTFKKLTGLTPQEYRERKHN